MQKYEGNLNDLHKNGNKIFLELEVLIISKQILSCLEFIHDKGFVHGALNSENILFDHERNVYLADYGNSYRFDVKLELRRQNQKNIKKSNGDEYNNISKLI